MWTCCCNDNNSGGGNLNTDFVDKSSIATATVSGDSNQPNTIQTLTPLRTSTGLLIVGDTIVNNIGGDYVEVDVHEYFQQNQNAGFARINPELELLKNGVVVDRSASAYQRHATGHDSSSNGISYVDRNPSVGDVWSLRSQQGSGQNDVLNIDLGSISVIVVEKIEVYKP